MGTRRREKPKLSKTNQTELEAFKGWAWNSREAKWEIGYLHLLGFVNKYGHSAVAEGFVNEEGFKLGNWLKFVRLGKEKLPDSKRVLLESLQGWVWHPLEKRFEIGFSHLKQFVEREGHAKVPKDYIAPDGYRLGAWVAKRRARKEILSAEQVQAFQDLNGWSWSLLDSFFDDGYDQLEQFVQKNNHALVPHNYITSEGFKLGIWVFGVRNRKATLSRDKILKLEKIETWVWSVKKHQFDTGMQHFKNFVHQEGHGAVPQNYATEDGFKLGGWVNNIRNRKKNYSKEVLQLLDEVGFIWDNPKTEKSFVLGLNNLQDYKKQNGHVLVPMKYISDNGFKLGSWVNRIRVKRKTISDNHLKLLNDVGFIWDASKPTLAPKND